jgi:hypothetical protein
VHQSVQKIFRVIPRTPVLEGREGKREGGIKRNGRKGMGKKEKWKGREEEEGEGRERSG